MKPTIVKIHTMPNGDQLAHTCTSHNEDEYVTGYMCKVEWDHEIGNASDGNKVYPSIYCLKEYSKCWEQCGIVEVKVLFSKIIDKGTFN